MLDSLQAYFLARENTWMLQVFGVVLATTTLALLVKRLLALLQPYLGKTDTYWDDAFIHALKRPLQVLVWVLGLNIASKLIDQSSAPSIFQHADRVREILVIVIMGWFLTRLVKEVERARTAQPSDESRLDTTSVVAISKLLRTAILISATLMLLQKLGYSISGVLAFGGIGGIAVGFAAKDLLANFFGALMIHLDRPFSVGEQIRSPDRSIEGTVESIGWRQTCIRTLEKRPLYIPNATFTTIAVENTDRMTHRRIQQVIGVRYDDWRKLPEIVEQLQAMLASHPDIDTEEALVVNFEKFSDSSLDILLLAYTRISDYAGFCRVRQDVFFRALELVSAAGAEISFPTRTLHLASLPNGVEKP